MSKLELDVIKENKDLKEDISLLVTTLADMQEEIYKLKELLKESK